MRDVSRGYAWIVGFILLSQALLAGVSFFLPPINNWLKTVALGELIIGYVTLESSIIACSIVWLNYGRSERQKSFEERFVNGIQDIAYARWLNVHEFYSVFLSEVTLCQHGANIAYLGLTPPNRSPDRHVREYYQQSVAVIKRRSDEAIHFRRIVRLTEANWPWILELCDELREVPIFSLAVLEDSGSGIRSPLALSVQTVDGQRTYLVAIRESTVYVPKRDLMIASRTITEGFATYYDRLWDRSLTIVTQGRVNEVHFEKAQARAEVS